MGLQYLHGIETIEVDDGIRPIQTVSTGVIGLIGTAPMRDTTKYPINEPFLIAGNQTVALEFGNVGTIPDALSAIFTQVGATIVVVVIEEGTSTNPAIQRLQTYANIVGNVTAKTGVHAFRKSNSVLKIVPKILIAPGFTSERPDDGITGAVVNTAGTEYVQASTTVTVTGGGGFGAAATALVNGSGGVQAITFQKPGVGYSSGTSVALGSFTFAAQPAIGDTLDINGTTVPFIANGTTAAGSVALGTSLANTMNALASFLNGSSDSNIDLATYTVSPTKLTVTSKAATDAANNFTLGASNSAVVLSGPTLTGGYSALQITIAGAGSSAASTATIGGAANPVSVELVALAPALRACVIVDSQGTSYEDAIAYEGDYDTDRLKIIEGFFQIFDANSAQNVVTPAAAFAAGKQAYMDQNFGFWWDFSNQPMDGITGVGRPIDWSYFDPNVEGQLLNSNNVAVCVHDDGFKVLGVRTPTSDSEWMFWSVRRTADAVYESIENALRTAIDRPISLALIDWIEISINAYLRTLASRGAILGGTAWLNPDNNSPADLVAGHLTIDFDIEPPAPLERLTFQAHRNDGYYSDLISEVLNTAVAA